jgi:DNA-binding MarR family transcriptional regulator
MSKSKKKERFDGLMLSRSRLGIIAALVGGDKFEFTFLRDSVGLSDGNLSVQLRKLEGAGYVKVEKVFVDRKPKTFCKITAKGRKALQKFVSSLEDMAGD